MNLLENIYRGRNKCFPLFLRRYKWAFYMLLLASAWLNSAQADLAITNITQTPANNVSIDQSVTYEVTVTYSGNGTTSESAEILIVESDGNVSSSFSSVECGLDGIFYCGQVSGTAVYRFTWTPPSEGNYDLLFIVNCSPQCGGNQQTISTIVSNSVPQEQPPVADAGVDQNITDTNNDGTESVTLDGSGSTDANNNIIGYEWFEGSQSLGSGVNLAVDLDVGVHTITLEVWDSSENVSRDEVVITVQAGSTSNPQGSLIETLSGNNQHLLPDESSDPLSIRVVGADGQPAVGVTITWTITPADAATLSGSTTRTDTNGETSNTVTPTATRPGSAFKVIATTSGGLSARFLVNPLATITGLTTAQRSIAAALDNACPALQSLTRVLTAQEQSLLATCDFLALASDQDIASALQQFLPDQIAAQGRNSISHSRIRNNNILFRLQALRSGVTGPDIENLSLSIQGERLPSILMSELVNSPRGGGASGDSSLMDSRLGMFVNGNVSFGDTETSDREAGFDFETSGLTLGVDYRYTDQFVLGGAVNYLSTASDYDSVSSTLDLDGYSLSLYGTYYQSEQVFVDGILSFGQNNYDSERLFQVGGTSHQLKGDTDGAEQALTIGGGYEIQMQSLTFVSQGRINYIRFKVDSYNEASSGSGVNLHIDEQDIESLTTSISGNLSMAYSTVYGVFIPYLSIEWDHEFQNDSRAIIARFVNDPTQSNFSVLTSDPDRDYFNLGLGVTAALRKGKSAFLHYEHLLGHNDTKQYSVTGGFRLEF